MYIFYICALDACACVCARAGTSVSTLWPSNQVERSSGEVVDSWKER